MAVPPGSLVRTVSKPLFSSFFLSFLICVLFPEPSGPSNVINKPLFINYSYLLFFNAESISLESNTIDKYPIGILNKTTKAIFIINIIIPSLLYILKYYNIFQRLLKYNLYVNKKRKKTSRVFDT